MSKEAKIGLAIVLLAVLVSVVLVGRTLSKKDKESASAAGSPTAAGPADYPSSSTPSSPSYPTGAEDPFAAKPAAPDGFGVGGGSSMDQLVSGAGTSSAAPAGSTGKGPEGLSPSPSSSSLPATSAPPSSSPPISTPSGAAAGPSKSSGTGEGLGLDALAAEKTHVVRKSDTLPALATKYYGSASSKKTALIAKANPGVDFKKPLVAGTALVIPPAPAKTAAPTATASAGKTADVVAASKKSGADTDILAVTGKPLAEAPAASRKEAPAAAAPAGRTHKVAGGENLSILADRYLGSASRYPEIIDANPGMTKESILKVGQKIVIPDYRNKPASKAAAKTGEHEEFYRPSPGGPDLVR